MLCYAIPYYNISILLIRMLIPTVVLVIALVLVHALVLVLVLIITSTITPIRILYSTMICYAMLCYAIL